MHVSQRVCTATLTASLLTFQSLHGHDIRHQLHGFHKVTLVNNSKFT